MSTNKNQKRSTPLNEWNLKLLYSSPDDPQIETDLETYKEKRRIFAQKYENQTAYLTSEEQLLEALTEYEQLLNDLGGAKPLMYFHYLTAISSDDNQAHANLNKITTQLTKAYNQLTFFPIKLGKIDPALQTKFLNSKTLARFHYFLSKRFELAKYDLTEAEEKILNLTDQTSYQMWVEGVTKAINKLTVKWQDRELPVSEAAQKIFELPTKDRRLLHQKVLRKLSTLSDFAESEINAIITNKTIEDELRGFKKPYHSRVMGSENDPEIIELLVETVSKNFDLSHKFYRLKARLLNLPSLVYADRNAQIQEIKKKYPFDQAKNIVDETFQELDPRFSQIFQRMLKNGQIDIYPRKNKVSGGFCSSSINNPTFVLLNHIDDFNSVSTLSHEMGHAIHSELSKKQPVLYQSYSTSIAETASTFFEQFVFEKLVSQFSAKDKIVALHNKLQDDINTIFRQIALFNFELELHQKIAKHGFLDSQGIGELLNYHMQSYLGPTVSLDNLDGNFYIFWSHIRNFFYTYTYAYGHLASKAMAAQVKKNPQTIEKVIEFLSAGGSAKPKEILRKVGIDITQGDFFNQGLKAISNDLDLLEKMTNSQKI
ncbi:MAG: Oligoendopeptidase, pepF/M3 family [Microgenomates bacterium 39_7]|nr:MAG: Oligoendopeptidase, pepF/M3 family [Microgenomates bacterium 39_7]